MAAKKRKATKKRKAAQKITRRATQVKSKGRKRSGGGPRVILDKVITLM